MSVGTSWEAQCHGNELITWWLLAEFTKQFEDIIWQSPTTTSETGNCNGNGNAEFSTISTSSLISSSLSSAITLKNLSSASRIHSYRHSLNASFVFTCTGQTYTLYLNPISYRPAILKLLFIFLFLFFQTFSLWIELCILTHFLSRFPCSGQVSSSSVTSNANI